MSTRADDFCPYSDGTAPPEPLTRREAEIAWWISEGLCDCEIAARLFLALNTVRTHRDNILRKLHFRCRVQIGVWIKLKYHGVLSLALGLLPFLEMMG